MHGDHVGSLSSFVINDSNKFRIDKLGLEFSSSITKHNKSINTYSYTLNL